MSALHLRGLKGLGWPAVTSLAFAVVAYGSVYLTTITKELAIIWPANGIFLSALLLSERRAGMLRVRRKWSDVLMLLVAGVGLIVLTIVVPHQPPT